MIGNIGEESQICGTVLKLNAGHVNPEGKCCAILAKSYSFVAVRNCFTAFTPTTMIGDFVPAFGSNLVQQRLTQHRRWISITEELKVGPIGIQLPAPPRQSNSHLRVH